MKKKQSEIIYIGVFLTVIFIACVSILVRFVASEIMVDRLRLDNGFTRAVLFDLQSDAVVTDAALLENGQGDVLAPFYPYPADATETAQADAAEADGAQAVSPGYAEEEQGQVRSRIAWFKEIVRYFEKGITNWTTDNLLAYKTWVGAASAYNKAMRWDVTPRDGYNSVVFLPDGSLTTFLSAQDMTEKADSILALKTSADALGIDFLYVQYPHKICKADPESGTLDFSNQNADQKLDLLRQNGVQTLDLRAAWHADGADDSAAYHRSAFYATDHHWRVETGLWAAGTIASFVNEHYGFSIDLSLFDPTRYQYDVFEDRFLGSYGRQVTLSITKPEDFTVVTPKFETSFDFPLLNGVQGQTLDDALKQSLENLSEKVRARNGSFEMFLERSMLEAGDYYHTDTYTAYTDNVNDLVSIHNDLVQDGKKVLFLRDSFGRSCVPFFALGVENTLRLRPDSFGGSLEAYFATERPDIVIVLEG